MQIYYTVSIFVEICNVLTIPDLFFNLPRGEGREGNGRSSSLESFSNANVLLCPVNVVGKSWSGFSIMGAPPSISQRHDQIPSPIRDPPPPPHPPHPKKKDKVIVPPHKNLSPPYFLTEM